MCLCGTCWYVCSDIHIDLRMRVMFARATRNLVPRLNRLVSFSDLAPGQRAYSMADDVGGDQERGSEYILSDREYYTACQLATVGKTKQLKDLLHETLRKREVSPLTFRSDHSSVTRKFSPLALAARYGRADTVKWLITAYRKAFDLNPSADDLDFNKELRHDLPLYWASQEGHLEVAKLLVSAGACVNLPNCMQATPLHAAAASGHLRVMEYLISKEAEVNVTDHLGITPLMAAASKGHIEVVELLLERGALASMVTAEGYTVMHVAAENGHTDVVAALLHSGVPPLFSEADADLEGYVPCPLLLAAASGHVDTVSKLLSHPECTEACRLDAVALLSIGAHQFTYRPTEHKFLFKDGAIKSIHDSEECNIILERCLGPGHVVTPTIWYEWRKKTYHHLSLDLYYERYKYENAALRKTLAKWQKQTSSSIYPDPVHVQTILRAHFNNTWSKFQRPDLTLLKDLLTLAPQALEVLRELQEKYLCEVIGGLDECLLSAILNVLILRISEDFQRIYRVVSWEAYVSPPECEEIGRQLVGSFLTFATGTSLLHLAINSRWPMDPHIVSVLTHCLLRWGATKAIDLPDWNGDRPLHRAALCPQPDISSERMTMLLRYGAHPDYVNRLGKTPLELCSRETTRAQYCDAVRTFSGPPRLACVACREILKTGVSYEELEISPAIKRLIYEHDPHRVKS